MHHTLDAAKEDFVLFFKEAGRADNYPSAMPGLSAQGPETWRKRVHAGRWGAGVGSCGVYTRYLVWRATIHSMTTILARVRLYKALGRELVSGAVLDTALERGLVSGALLYKALERGARVRRRTTNYKKHHILEWGEGQQQVDSWTGEAAR